MQPRRIGYVRVDVHANRARPQNTALLTVTAAQHPIVANGYIPRRNAFTPAAFRRNVDRRAHTILKGAVFYQRATGFDEHRPGQMVFYMTAPENEPRQPCKVHQIESGGIVG